MFGGSLIALKKNAHFAFGGGEETLILCDRKGRGRKIILGEGKVPLLMKASLEL